MKITYTTFEAARINGVDEATVRRQCANGKIAGAYKELVREREVWRIPAEALFTDYTESDDGRAPFERERDAARAVGEG